MLSVNFIGCGKLGKTIAILFKQHNIVKINGIVNTSIESAHHARRTIGAGTAFEHITALPQADIYFITTPDDCVEEIATKLQISGILNEKTIILHCSGSLSSEILKPIKNSKGFAASIHPIKSFAHPKQTVATFSGTYCAMEGDVLALSTIAPLFEKMGGIPFLIKKENKKIYHAGSVIANNYLVTLHYHATQCYIHAGIEEKIAEKIASQLMYDALNNINHLSHDKALTGPIQRGDAKTVADHINAFENKALGQNDTKNIYLTMGRGTVPLTHHSSTIKQKLIDLFSVVP